VVRARGRDLHNASLEVNDLVGVLAPHAA
jgi:hypothetical protein